MPRGDGTGPRGQGPGKGRGMWVKAAVAVVKAVEAEALEVVLRQDRVDIVSVPTAVKEQSMNWGTPVMNRNVLSAELL